MKKMMSVIILFLVSQSALALTYSGPLLEKRYTSGFVPPFLSESKTCEIYADRVVITETAHMAEVTVVKEASVSGVIELIAEAKKGKITESQGPIDGPETTYKAYQVGPSDVEEVTLKTDGFLQKSNDKREALPLIRMLDKICG